MFNQPPSMMEPILENDSGEELERAGHSPGGRTAATSPLKCKENESKCVKKEFFCTEKVESTKRLISEDRIADLENRCFDPSQLGPAEMSSTTFKYSYESTCDPLPLSVKNDQTVEQGAPGSSRIFPVFHGAGGPPNSTGNRYFDDVSDFSRNLQQNCSLSAKNDEKSWNDENQRFFDERIETKEHEVQNGYVVVENDERVNVERQLNQTEKVTRVTKVTTTRTIQHLPADQQGSMGGVEYRIISSPSQENGFLEHRQRMKPIQNCASNDMTDSQLSDPLHYEVSSYGHYSENPFHEQSDSSYEQTVPSKPGAPQIVDIDSDRVTIVWLRPEVTSMAVPGRRVPFLGYQVHYRPRGDPQWYIANDDIIAEPLCTIENLNPNGEYELRVVARNSNGFGPPSPPTLVQLRPSLLPVVSTDRIRMDSDVPSVPGRPRVTDCDGTTAVRLCWEAPVFGGKGGPVLGYRVEYRVVPSRTAADPSPSSVDWIASTDRLTPHMNHLVSGLRPNGGYEFRIFAKNVDGFSEPSRVSEIFVVRPFTDGRLEKSPDLPPNLNGSCAYESPEICMPGRPAVTEFGPDWATLAWQAAEPGVPAHLVDRLNLHFLVEFREVGNPEWFLANEKPIFGTQYTVTNLHKNSVYEFRIIARSSQGLQSQPSANSQLCQLHSKFDSPLISPANVALQRQVPAQPTPPEILAIVDDCVTICWTPAKSNTPLQGYQVEFRDCTEPPHDWLAVNSILTHSIKMTIGDLVPQRQYEFRVTAKNSIGYSRPSGTSQPVFIGFLNPTEQQAHALNACQNTIPTTSVPPLKSPLIHREYSFASDVPLPVEMSAAKESPPITDTDDSPPPIRRKPPGSDGVTYRDPTLPEVLDYLTCSNNVLKLNASGYLQHLTFNDETMKHKVRELDGIPRIIELLKNEVPEVQKNACGCLRNLSFGIDENKKAILNAGGVPALSGLLKKTPDMQILEEISSVLWNLSSHDDVKPAVLEFAVDPLVKQIVVPYSGWSPSGHFTDWRQRPPAVFRNATGVLRNASCASDGRARQTLRCRPGLIDALLHFLHLALVDVDDRSAAIDGKSVENVACVVRNLCYRLQEIEDPDYEKKCTTGLNYERSKSAPSSPKFKNKTRIRKDEKEGKRRKEAEDASSATNPLLKQPATGIALVWQPEVVRDYLKLLAGSSNPDTLESTAGAIQNLAACYWKPSVDVRATVRKEKGLPILIRLLSVENDKVVCAAATALRNLSLDPRNKDLIGKFAMEDLVKKLPPVTAPPPRPTQNGSSQPTPAASDETVAAVLSAIYATTVRSPDFSRILLEKGGVERLVRLSNSRQYNHRVAKYAAQVLFAVWQHRELHDAFKRAGFSEDDFVSRGAGQLARNADTLARPMSTRGAPADRQKRRQQQQLRSAVRPDLKGDDDQDEELNDETEKYCSASTLRGNVTPFSGYSPTSHQRPLRSTSDDYESVDARTPLVSLQQQTPSPGLQTNARPQLYGTNPETPYAQIQKKKSTGREKDKAACNSSGAKLHSPTHFNGTEGRAPLLRQAPQQPMDSWV